MPKRQLHYAILFVVLTTAFYLYKSFSPQNVYSALSNHVVISEIQISGNSANDEFVELYNPTGSAINLEGWRLTRKTASGTESNLIANISGTIPANGYFLITHASYEGSTTADSNYSATSNAIASNNTVILYSDAGVTMMDKVGMGNAIDFEVQAVSNPEALGSIERKANSYSTSQSMSAGGLDEHSGNGEDSENNVSDFVVKTISTPQNNLSQTEASQAVSATPTPSVSTTPSPTPTTTQSVVLISEVQISGTTATDEFVELYNPTQNVIDLTGWKLAKKTVSGTQSNLVTELPENSLINSYGYFLIAHNDYDDQISSDQQYSTSSSLASNNTVILIDADGNISDKVGMGEAVDFESQAYNSPDTDISIERKASAGSTVETMQTGGEDEYMGNRYDTNNNHNDFITRNIPNPQNKNSALEPRTDNVTPTPTLGITSTPTPTLTTTPIPTTVPSTPTPTIGLTPTPTPTPTPGNQGMVIAYFPLSNTTCRLHFEIRKFRFFIMISPRIVCSK
ncbi:lamin tail domain-containing protein [Candidatus Woesebacteria bacterium]|nr:MAG: lamin tail domain-containing protein [Candidatus Woesebacteria bacterium]